MMPLSTWALGGALHHTCHVTLECRAGNREGTPLVPLSYPVIACRGSSRSSSELARVKVNLPRSRDLHSLSTFAVEYTIGRTLPCREVQVESLHKTNMAPQVSAGMKSPTASTSSSASSLATPSSGDAAWRTFIDGSLVGAGMRQDTQVRQRPYHWCDEALADLLFPPSDRSGNDDCEKCDMFIENSPHAWNGVETSHNTWPSAHVLFEPCSDEACSMAHLAVPSSCCDGSDSQDLWSFPCNSYPLSSECCTSGLFTSSNAQCAAYHCNQDFTSCPTPRSVCVTHPCTDYTCGSQAAPHHPTDHTCSDDHEKSCNLCTQGSLTQLKTLAECRACTDEQSSTSSTASSQQVTDIYQSFQELLDYCSDTYAGACCSPHSSAQPPTGTITPSTIHDSNTPKSFFNTKDDSLQTGNAGICPLADGMQGEVRSAEKEGSKFNTSNRNHVSGACKTFAMGMNQTANKKYANPLQGLRMSNARSHCPLTTVSAQTQCRWAGCSESFDTVDDLLRHFHDVHLPSEADKGFNPSIANTGDHLNVSQVCQWGSCVQPYQSTRDNESEGSSADAVAAMLQHLLQTHVGSRACLEVSPWSQSTAHISTSHVNLIPSPSSESEYHNIDTSRLSPPMSYTGMSTRTPELPSSPVTSSGGQHACGWIGCRVSFPNHQDLTDHIVNEHIGGGKSLYSCGWVGCTRAAEGKTFVQRQKILRHVQTHTGDRPFKCELCSRRFFEANTLAQHMRTHTREKPHVCDYPGCGASFAVAGSLTIHKRSRHTFERPFVCSWPGCGRAFAESSNLTKHRRIHSGERPFPCKLCDRKFSRPDQLQRHMRVHDVAPPGETSKPNASAVAAGALQPASSSAPSKMRRLSVEIS